MTSTLKAFLREQTFREKQNHAVEPTIISACPHGNNITIHSTKHSPCLQRYKTSFQLQVVHPNVYMYFKRVFPCLVLASGAFFYQLSMGFL